MSPCARLVRRRHPLGRLVSACNVLVKQLCGTCLVVLMRVPFLGDSTGCEQFSMSHDTVHERAQTKSSGLSRFLVNSETRHTEVKSQISTADRTPARTGPDTQRAQAHNHTQNSSTRTQPRHTSRSHAHTHPSRHTPSATPTRERTRQGNHGLRDLHRPFRQRLRPLPPLLCCTCRSRPTSSSCWRRVRPANCDCGGIGAAPSLVLR